MASRDRLYDHPRSKAAKTAAKDGDGNDMPETQEEFYKDLEEPSPEEKALRERQIKRDLDDIEKGRIKPTVIDVDTPEGKEELKRRMRDIRKSKQKEG